MKKRADIVGLVYFLIFLITLSVILFMLYVVFFPPSEKIKTGEEITELKINNTAAYIKTIELGNTNASSITFIFKKWKANYSVEKRINTDNYYEINLSEIYGLISFEGLQEVSVYISYMKKSDEAKKEIVQIEENKGVNSFDIETNETNTTQKEIEQKQNITCIPNCTRKTCGDNGCGGVCGTCNSEYYCDKGTCLKVPSKTKAIWLYPSAPKTEMDKAVSKGINTFIVKSDVEQNFRPIAQYSKQNNISFIAAISFVEYAQLSKVTNETGLYYDDDTKTMNNSILVPFLSRKYWNHFTEKIKNLSKISKEQGYRIDGVLIDFELYETINNLNARNESMHYYTYEAAYDDETFADFIAAKKISSELPERMKRRDWLVEKNLLSDYKDFIKSKTQELAAKMESELRAINPDFSIGFYPSYRWDYSRNRYTYQLLLEASKSWTKNKPLVLYATDMYGGGGSAKIPIELKLTNEDYFYFERKDTGEKIKIYYLPGFLLRAYNPEMFSSVLDTAKQTNGYWLFTLYSLYTACGREGEEYYRLAVNCGNDLSDPSCCKNQFNLDSSTWNSKCCPYYPAQIENYWKAINQLNSDLNYQEKICDYSNLADLDNGCKNSVTGYWKFDGNALDELGLHNGIVFGADPTTGKFGQAYNFANKKYLSLNNFKISPNQGSVSMWVYPTKFEADNETILFWQGEQGGDGWGGQWEFHIGSNNPNDGRFDFFHSGNCMITSTTNYKNNLNKWYHIVAAYDSSSCRIYVNGQLEASDAYANSIDNSKFMNEARIARPQVDYRYFQGKIDELMIFDKKLSSEEVLKIYQKIQ